ncbi:hypothetical protein [Phaeobacter gallaeciensis]|uniref:hypothetical protein n=1 Tax=Phaeobacter gallaeciensis TaxID=60890 RepID=UPI00237F4826|nr:hypothetical protein [Phaeobacter gallaeciensis]MDE4061912.1 hypothetical protein [Phaeobacter gallaeciensis]MDE4124900.1 hypothetical protein [Phaeobacter gallaeciensis]MDE4129372.1 hypothetical protein [Phaeobacter gallaeciensis]
MRQVALATAVMIAVPGLASAQSVLERVLGQIDGASNLAQVNGTYANIAESVGAVFTTTTTSTAAYAPTGSEVLYEVANYNDEGPNWTPVLTVTYDMLGTSGTVSWFGVDIDYTISADGRITLDPAGALAGTYDIFAPNTIWTDGSNLERFVVPTTLTGTSATAYADGAGWYSDGLGGYYYLLPTVAGDLGYDPIVGETVTETTTTYVSTVIDGSIANPITGVTAATAEVIAGAATVTEFTLPTVDLGDLSTTALGAVNTGEITLGVNSAVDEAATTTTRAISAAMTQIGGSADTGALVLNVAHNASAVNGSIQNTMIAVNGSIGSASTTALGAVNTGTIASGVNAAVQGIVGMTGQTSSGL